MKPFPANKEHQIRQSIQNALEKAHAEGQPVRELAEAAAMGKELDCCFVSTEDGKERLLVWIKEE